MNILKRQNAISPFRLLEEFNNEINRLFNEPYVAETDKSTWGANAFAVDIRNEKDAYVLEADLPGFDKKDIQVKMDADVLRIQAERKKEIKEGNYYERSYGRFERALRLPTDVEAQKVKADYKDGVLKISIPKAEEAKAKQLEVKVE